MKYIVVHIQDNKIILESHCINRQAAIADMVTIAHNCGDIISDLEMDNYPSHLLPDSSRLELICCPL